MAYVSRKTEHAGAKKGSGAFWGPKQIAKHGSNRKRRRDARVEIDHSATDEDLPDRCVGVVFS